MPATPPAESVTAHEALERLAAGLDGRHYAVTLTRSPGRRPHLHVTNRAAAMLTEHIYCDGDWYWFGWAERIAPVTDIAAAVTIIKRVLRTLDAG